MIVLAIAHKTSFSKTLKDSVQFQKKIRTFSRRGSLSSNKGPSVNVAFYKRQIKC